MNKVWRFLHTKKYPGGASIHRIDEAIFNDDLEGKSPIVFENKDGPSEYILNHCELLQKHCSIVACNMHHKNLLMDFGLNNTSPK